jgi:hypothetical protein
VVQAPSKTEFTRPKVETIRQNPQQLSASIANSALAIIGKWSGTRTNDEGLHPGAVAFELTSNGEFIMADAVTGQVSSKGVYNYANNTITGSYKMFSSGETIAFAGSYDPFTKQMICTLGMGNPPRGQGKWTVTKQ